MAPLQTDMHTLQTQRDSTDRPFVMSACCSRSLPACGQRMPVRGLDPSLAAAPPAWPRPRPRPRRPLRVLYPPVVKRPLPREEPSLAKRWLFLLSAVLFLQIYTEEGAEGPQGPRLSGLVGLQEPQLSGLERGPQGPQIYIEDVLEGPHMRDSAEALVQTRGPGLQWPELLPPPPPEAAHRAPEAAPRAPEPAA
ncbi:hypothetical protein AAFF_G00067170 [Aldrovandia affinis]|uniref:Radiation-inducible immediate-early gene IEX-1 n=1 Tax=Aldrovandia affinis TaxID=143900 RepID=A0AAD7WZQ9_9TELE|nr:hypothetical protein AAFF_G00067170 [Aldrovandia affinis]